MRIGVGGIYQETNTFATSWMGYARVDDFRVDGGPGLIDAYAGTATEIGGMISAAQDAGIEVVPLSFAIAVPGPTIARDCYDALARLLIDAIDRAGPMDALALALHGAGTVDAIGSLEEDLLALVRAKVGPRVPVIATLDLHAMVPGRAYRDVDLLLPYHEYPHTDMVDRGREALEQALALAKDPGATRTAVVHVPLLVTAGATAPGEPMHEILDACADVERAAGCIDASIQHGFPFSDVPDAGVHVTVTVREGAEIDPSEAATDIARRVWAQRDRLVGRACSPGEAIARARELARTAPKGRPVVISDGADNPGGAAPGDSTHLLRACLDAGLAGVIIAALTDPAAVAAAHAAGVGATIDIELGGHDGPLQGAPVSGPAVVRAIADGRWEATTLMGAGATYDMGPSALLSLRGVDIIACTRRTQVFDPAVLAIHAVAPTDYSVVIVKSSTHFRAGFEGIAHAIISADAPGVTSLDLSAFSRQASDPLPYPLHPHARWEPSATVWARQ